MFTKYAIDTFISDKVSKVTECNSHDPYDEFPEARDWVSQYIAIVVLVAHPRKEVRPFVLQLLRRSQMALLEYSRACEELSGFVSQHDGKWSLYFQSLHHFEAAIIQLYLAHDYARKKLDIKLFDGDDGSPLSRLNTVYNKIKHQVAEEDQTIWITNEGIECDECKLTFAEIEDILRTLAKLNNRILHPKKPDLSPGQ